MSASSSSSGAAAAGEGGGNASSGGSQGPAKKTNVCLICGIYTNLSLNIFEPRNGPNIREVIYQKYNFKAERGDNEDKYICYSCNNWLINWYSLQHLSESRNYESTPSSSRSQSENRNKRPKNGRSNSSSTAAGSSRDKENVEQDDQVSSTVKTPEKASNSSSPKRKPKRAVRRVLTESSKQNLLSNESNSLVKSFESHLIRMLENQGTSVTKENAPSAGMYSADPFNHSRITDLIEKGPHCGQGAANNNEIVLSFNSVISEVVDVMPSLKLMRHEEANPAAAASAPLDLEDHFINTRRLSRSLSISIINAVSGSDETAANP